MVGLPPGSAQPGQSRATDVHLCKEILGGTGRDGIERFIRLCIHKLGEANVYIVPDAFLFWLSIKCKWGVS